MDGGILSGWMDFLQDLWISPSLHRHHKACFQHHCFPDTMPGGACGSMKLSWAVCGGLLGFLVGGWIS